MIYVLGDVHGNTRRFNSIMEQIAISAEDTLYVLGDMIDRFPDGIKLLRTIMGMTNVHMLLGNHEYMMLNALNTPDDERALSLWYQNGGRVTHDYLKHLRKTTRGEVFDYLRTLPLNIDVTVNGTNYKLVHGAPVELFEVYGWRYANETEFAVWKRWRDTEYVPKGYTLVFGHTPTEYYQANNPLKIWFEKNRIGIDCGSGYPETPCNEYSFRGRLSCLRLEDMREFYSKETEIAVNEKATDST